MLHLQYLIQNRFQKYRKIRVTLHLQNLLKALKKVPRYSKKDLSPFYKRKILLKPDGRKRLIASPAPFLKKYQNKILEEILEKVELPSYCTGFVKNRSIVSNAEIHVGSQTLVKIDLQNFFNSMKFMHVYYVFRGFGYNRSVSGILACICTDWYTGRKICSSRSSKQLHDWKFICKNLDIRLKGLWDKERICIFPICR